MAIGGLSKSRNLLAHKRLQKRQSVRRVLLETLETRQLLAVGPQLIGIQPNTGDLLQNGEVLQVSPRELVFRFSDDVGIDPTTLGGIRVVRSGDDGVFERASVATDLGTGGQTLVEFYAATPGQAGNGIALRFTTASRSDTRDPVLRVSGRQIDVELNTNPSLTTRVEDLLRVFDRNAGTVATNLVFALPLRGSQTLAIGSTVDTSRTLILSGANAAKASTNFGLSNSLEVRFVATDGGNSGLGTKINVSSVDRGGAGAPTVTVSGKTINVVLNSNPRFATTAREFVDAINANTAAASLLQAQLVSGSGATRIGAAATSYSPITLSGVTDIEIIPGYIGLGASNREVVLRFAEALPDDNYRIEILGQGIRTLRNVNGEAFNMGASSSVAFELQLGAQILSVVPQPVTRDPATGAISWTRQDEIDIYFSHDQLIDVKSIATINGLTVTQMKAERNGVLYLQNSDTIVFTSGVSQRGVLEPKYYQLINSKGTLDTADDASAENPVRIRYYPDADRVSLRFQRSLDQYATNGGELRLRVGTNEQGLAAPKPLDTTAPASDPADTFAGSLVLATAPGTPWSNTSTGSQSILISSKIENQTPFTLDFPGGGEEPGTRDIRMQSNLRLGADNIDGISTLYYNFQGQLGVLGGSTLLNAITEQQKTRVREVMSLYERYLGARFIESPNLGMTIAVGDMRAIVPFPDVAGGPAGVVEGNQPGFTAYEAGTLASGQPATVLDSQDFSSSTVNNFGGTFTRAAMQAIGKLLGLGDSDELEQLTVQSSNAIFAPGVGTEIVLPGDADIVHGQYLYRPDSKDIDLYQFKLPVAGKLSIEAFAERMSSASLLDSQIRLYQQTPSGWTEIAANDDYFSSDSYLELDLASGNYIVGVSAAGNASYDPSAPDTGIGGRSQGNYQLRMDFQPPAPSVLRDADSSIGTEIDGDGDGTPGGVFNFWFRPSNNLTTKFVDKSAPNGGTGSIAAPFNKLSDALNSARLASATTPGVVVRVLGNGGADKNFATQADNLAYEIGFDSLGAPLADGTTFDVPKGVTVMVDAGAILKFRRARVGVGSTSVSVDRSGGALLVLGTPTLQTAGGSVLKNAAGDALSGSVVMTSFNDVSLGKTSKTPTATTGPGDWGGIDIRNRVDNANGNERLEKAGIFLNWVSNADIRYGGGQVVIDGVSQVVSPIQMVDSRPTIISNIVTNGADAALSATPNSFLESNFNSPQEQGAALPFTVDYDRVGPEIHGNRLLNNSVNGLQVRVRTNSATQLEKLTTQGRFDDVDIVHYLPESLEVSGTPGGALLVQNSTSSEVVSRLDARLVIDPGTIVKSQGSRLELAFGSQLIAEGTPGNPVVFTSINDVRYGAGGTFDTGNRKGSQTVSPGDWGGIFVGQTSKASFDNAVVAYGGGTTRVEGGFADFDAIEVHQGDLRLVNSTIEFNADGTTTTSDPNRGGRGTNSPAAIFIRGAQPIIVGNIIRDNLAPALSANVNSLNSTEVIDAGRSRGKLGLIGDSTGNRGPLLSGNLMSNNETDGLVVRGGPLTTEGVWDDTDIVHVVLDQIIVPNFQTYGGLRLQSSPSRSLVVKLRSSPGSTAGFTATGKSLDIADRIGGSLRIVGTPGKPVILTSLSDDSVSTGFTASGETQQQPSATPAAAGDWAGIRFEPLSNDRNVATVLENESAAANSPNANGTPATSQYLGGLAPNEYAGDENRRLGFEVHGAISSPTDQDVYSFEAQAGTEVWLDIDRTQNTLDTIVELVDADGRTLARSNNSAEEEANPALLKHVFDPLDPPNMPGHAAEISADAVNPLRLSTPELYPQSAAGVPKDLYSTNPGDAGLRVSLPGGTGTTNLYHIRVRSTGTTKGTYQLQVRLSEVDEVPGSTISYAEIRYAETGIQLVGVPLNSPLLGENGETENQAGGNDTFANAQALGNLLQTNRQALSVSGNLDSSTDVDWFSFDIDYQSIRPTSIREYFSTIFDVDYADGLGRPDTSIYVFDSRGYLILGGLGSDLVDDQASPLNGADNSDLSRGSAGNLDPYVDSYELPAGRYFVAVTNSSRIPEAMDQFTIAGSTNPLVRLQPIESVQLIAEDHVSFNGGSTFAGPIVSNLFSGNSAAVPWNLGDIVLYVSRDAGAQTDLFTVNPFTGETAIAFNNRQAFDIEDIAFRPNGELRAFDRGLIGPQPADLDTSIDYISIDTGTGAYTATANALGLETFHNVQTITAGPPLVITNTATDSNDGIHPEAITFGVIGSQEYGFLAGNRNPNPAPLPAPIGTTRPDVDYFRNIIYQFNEATGAAEGAVKTGTTLYQGAGTNITDRGFIETAAPAGTVSTTLVATEVTATSGGARRFVISDGDIFTIRDVTGVPINRTFEFDLGPEVIVNYNPAAGLGVRDGMQFTLDGTSYQFDTGNVVVVDANLLSDGAKVAITNSLGVTRTYEFDSNGVAAPGNVVVPFAAGATQTALAQALVTAVNSNLSFGVRAGTVAGSGRVSFLGASTTVPVVVTGAGLSLTGTLGVSGGVRIPILESATESEFVAAIVTAMPGTISASYESGRMNFSGALNANFGDLATNGIFTVLRTSSGVGAASRIPVNVQASDSAETVAKRIAAAINGLGVVGLSATASGTDVRLFAASVVSSGPLKASGVAPGGTVTGIAVVGNTLYAVSNAGGLYFVNNPQARTGGSIGTYVSSSSDLLGINFTGLVAGPSNTVLTGGRQVLFGIDSNGRIYAFDTAGRLQPVFANGATSVLTSLPGGASLTGANGLALSTLQRNLWSQTNAADPNDNTNRETDAGHGLLNTPNNSRGSTTGGTSYYFGDNTVVNYNFPGGAAGALESNKFSLKGLSAADLPMLYFSYFLESDNTNGINMQDAFRVYGSGEDGNWLLLATNNSDPLRELAQSADVQELFDNTGGWRQARVPLDRFAGQDNIKLRVEFSTGAGFGYGRQGGTGPEIRTIAGSDLLDGQILTLNGQQFEIEMGPTLTLPSRAAISNGQSVSIDGIRYVFTDGSGAPVVAPDVAVTLTPTTLTADDVALALQSAITAATAVVPVFGGLNFAENNDVISHANASGITGETIRIIGTGTIGDRLIDADKDVDLVRIELRAGSTVTVNANTTTIGSALNSVLRLFDAEGREVARSAAGAGNSQMNFVATKTGTYYVGVSGSGNASYDAVVPGLTSIGSTGNYQLQIEVRLPLATAIVGNRLQLLGASVVSISAGAPISVQGAAGTSGVPVNITADMSANQVAAVLQAAIANRFANGNNSVYPIRSGDTIGLTGLTVNNRGPFGLTTQLPGEVFTTFNSPARAQNNNLEGVYVDDFIIGIAGRGEMVLQPRAAGTGVAGDTDFIANPDATNQILTGPYQFEIRGGENYGRPTTSSLVLQQTFPLNDRSAPGLSIRFNNASSMIAGQTFTVGDGPRVVTFELDDINDAVAVAPGNVALPFSTRVVSASGATTSESAEVIAARFRDLLNSPAIQERISVTGNLLNNDRFGATSDTVVLIGNATATVPSAVGQKLANTREGGGNRERPQGQIVINGVRVSDSAGFGATVEAAPRDATTNVPQTGSPRNTITLNTEQLSTGAVIMNSEFLFNASGGISVTGDSQFTTAGTPAGTQAFVRLVNNTVVGGSVTGGATPTFAAGGTGISVTGNATATILNNVVVNSTIGINVDASSDSTIVGGTVYQLNGANVGGVATLGQFPLLPSDSTQLFQDIANRNLYPAAGSSVIDSSIDSLEDRLALVAVKEPLGLSASPILSPDFDINGQLRVDDPTVDTPAGLGERVFKDRGAQDRADFAGPSLVLLSPVDNDFAGLDGNPAAGIVELTGGTLRYFDILLEDGLEPSDPSRGAGIDHTTVSSSSVLVYGPKFVNGVRLQNQPLVHGRDYVFGYDSTNGIIRLTPLAGIWEPESVYTVRFLNTSANAFVAQATYTDGQQISLVDSTGKQTTFELDFGSIVTVPAPPADPTSLDGKTFSVDDGAKRVVFEYDIDGSVTAGNTAIDMTSATTSEGVGRLIQNAINSALLNLTVTEIAPGVLQIQGSRLVVLDPIDSGLAVVGAPGVQTGFGIQIPQRAGVPFGLTDGQTFTINRTGTPVTFELDTNGSVTSGNRAVAFAAGASTATVAAALVSAIQSAALGLTPMHAGNGLVTIGGDAATVLDMTQTALSQSGIAGQAAAIAIPVSAVAQSPEAIATLIKQAIDGQNLPGVVTTQFGDRVLVEGAASATGVGAQSISAIRDLAGNPIKSNQPDGSTQVTIFLGEGLDYGDAPAPYLSSNNSNGPRHKVVNTLRLGAEITADADARVPDADVGDDGITAFPTLSASSSASVTIGVSNTTGSTAYVSLWIDFDGNGVFADAERVANSLAVTGASTTVTFAVPRSTATAVSVPSSVKLGDTFARLRLSTNAAAVASPLGAAPDGEVEDYKVTIQASALHNASGIVDALGNGLDVNADGYVSAIDVLQVINWINDPPAVQPTPTRYVDVNGDGIISAQDVMALINFLNNQPRSPSGEGEGESGLNSLDSLAEGEFVMSSNWAGGLEDLLRPRSVTRSEPAVSAWDQALLDTESADDNSAIASSVASAVAARTADLFWSELDQAEEAGGSIVDQLSEDLLNAPW